MTDSTTTTGSLVEWTDQAIPPGSGRYYALLHSEPSVQEHQKRITTLVSIFSKLGFQSREIEVAKHKLNWWRVELEKDNFQHPVMTSLTHPSDLFVSRLGRLLNAYGALLENGSPSTDAQNQTFHNDSGAIACQLLCNTTTDIDAVSQVGIALSKVRCHRYLRPHVDHGLLCLPMSALDNANISPALLTPDNTDQSVQNFLQDRQDSLINELQQAQSALATHAANADATSRKNYKSLYIYSHLQLVLLKSMADGSSVLNQINRLTPLKNYWQAFLAARRFDRL